MRSLRGPRGGLGSRRLLRCYGKAEVLESVFVRKGGEMYVCERTGCGEEGLVA